MKKSRVKYFLLTSIILIVGCAYTPTINNMVAPYKSYNESDKSIKIGQISGGEEINPLIGVSKIDDTGFYGALELSLKMSRIFIYNMKEADYTLKALIVSQKQPMMGLNMTSSLTVNYVLFETDSRREIWSKSITSNYTAKFGDTLDGGKRIQFANEGVVRENLGILLESLSSLGL